MPYLVVPSDINVLENKVKIGRQAPGIFEAVGLMLNPPMYHSSFSKLDTSDMRAILTKKYDASSMDPAVEICRTRQAAVSKAVKAHIGAWAGTFTFGGLTYWSLRRYNIQASLIAVPFLAYAGSWVGRVAGDMWQVRNGETYRDRFLGNLPAKVYYNNGK